MKYFALLGGILLTCFCVLIYLAQVKAYRTNELDPDLLGATTSAIMLEGAKASRGKNNDISGISGRLDKLESFESMTKTDLTGIQNKLSDLENRLTKLEANR